MKTINKCIIQAFIDNEIDVLVHQVNCQGVMGAGIAKEIVKVFPSHYQYYKQQEMFLSNHMIDTLSSNQHIVGLFAQDKVGTYQVQTNVAAFAVALTDAVNELIEGSPHNLPITIGFPYKIGCGLAGGSWDTISLILEDMSKLVPENITFVIYKKV